MYKVLKQLQQAIKSEITDELQVPVYVNRVPEDNSRKMSIALRWQEDSAEIITQLDNENDITQMMELFLFSDTSNNDQNNTNLLDKIKALFNDYVYFGDFSIMDVALFSDAEYIGVERTTTNSIYVIKFKVLYGS